MNHDRDWYVIAQDMNLAIKISFRLSVASTACKAGRPWAACLLAGPSHSLGFPISLGQIRTPVGQTPHPIVGIASYQWFQISKMQLVVELFSTIPTGCRRLWNGSGREGEGEREGQGSAQRGWPGSAQLVFVQSRSWYSVPQQRPINGNGMSLWI